MRDKCIPNVTDLDVDALRSMAAPELLRWAFETFGPRAAIGTSLQKTGLVIIDMASRLGLTEAFRVFFVDTLINYPETYALLAEVEQRYGLRVERFEPSQASLDALYEQFGQHPHYFARELCCRRRKVLPLQDALETLDVWIAGVRSDQSEHREQAAEKAALVLTEKRRQVLKLNPLADWTQGRVDEYTRIHAPPHNKLYDFVSPYNERFSVIGCRPCHIPVKPEFGKRAGKFPWEAGKKECGLHEHGDGI